MAMLTESNQLMMTMNNIFRKSVLVSIMTSF